MSYLGNKPGLGQTGIADLAPDVLEALKNAFFGTPEQFDNDLSLVTSAFVQRALGNRAGALDVNSGAFGDATYSGKNLNIGAGSSYLPSTVGMANGVVLHYKNTGVGVHTLSRVGSDLISCDGTTQTSITVGLGEELTLVRVNDIWIGSGAAALKYAAGFGASLAANGYQKLPSGLIIQWGITPVAAGGAGGSLTTTTFPIAFPNACRKVLVSPQDSSLNSSGLKAFYTPDVTKTLTSFGLSAYSDAAIAAIFTYIAIGY